jgi:hypothetical protein
MKKIFILILCFFIGLTTIKAEDDTDKFYYDEFVPNMRVSITQGSNSKNAKIAYLRRLSDQKTVYCIEPFVLVDTNNFYRIANHEINDTFDYINLLNYYGYGYENHTDLKWYGITQFLIWKAIGVDEIYLTDNDKNITNMYDNEINELSNLVNNHYLLPSFIDDYNLMVGKTYVFEDSNQVLLNYDILVDSNYIDYDIKENNLYLTVKQVGKYSIQFIKKIENVGNDYFIYSKENSQTLFFGGYIPSVSATMNIDAYNGNLTLTKVDSKTGVSQGEASLMGAKYGLYYQDKLLDVLVTNSQGQVSTSLPYGTYYIKEIEPSTGYLLDPNSYNVTIDEKHVNIDLEVNEDVIKSNVTIHKKYGDNEFYDEENVTFEIYDNNNILYQELTTDKFGIISMELPYGTYTVKQVTTTLGYTMSDEFSIVVNDCNDQVYDIVDYKEIIPPDTGVYDSIYNIKNVIEIILDKLKSVIL